MFTRSFISVLIVTSSFILAIGQDAPEAKKEKEKKIAKSFAFSFDGDGGYLGVQTQEVNKENFSKFGLRNVRGVAVEKVMENSPAAAAGIQNNDVIVRLNGEEVTSTRKLSRLISEVAPDHQVSLTILRNGNEKDIKATLGKRQSPKFENGNFSFNLPDVMEKDLMVLPELRNLPRGEGMRMFKVPPGGEGKSFAWKSGEGRQIGISVYPVTKQLGERFGVDGGVMINNVREDSPAAKAGLKAGDIIVEAEGKAIKNTLDLMRALSDKKEGDVQLTFLRDRNRQTISVTPEMSKDGGFFFQTDDDEEGMLPAMPGKIHLTTPAVPVAPVIAPAPMTFVHPGSVI
ncbi:MAG: PDZ domain-containing protein [Pyrinomonadaceae bacterium]